MREAVWNNNVYKKCNAFRKNFLENRENRENKNVWTISTKNDNFVKIHEISKFRGKKGIFVLTLLSNAKKEESNEMSHSV